MIVKKKRENIKFYFKRILKTTNNLSPYFELSKLFTYLCFESFLKQNKYIYRIIDLHKNMIINFI